MKTKDLDKNYITDKLSEIPYTWTYSEKTKDKNFLNSVFRYLSKIKKQNPKISIPSNLKPEEIPYNSSIFHFILYYTYHPKYPFIIFNKNTLIFGAFTGRNFNRIEISFPLKKNALNSIKNLNWLLSINSFKSILEKNNIKSILIRDVDDDFVNLLKNKSDIKFRLESLRELNYATYNLSKTLNLTGSEYSNLRWHLNKFNDKDHEIELASLDDNVKSVIHLIGKWRKKAIDNRGFSYINVKSDKLGAKLFKDFNKYNYFKEIFGPENIISRVLKVNGKISSFNLGFPLGIFNKQNVFSHSIGISDISIPHLAEYAQYDFWKEINNKGYDFVNDGPTWKNNLETYKNKFRPITKKRYYFMTISLNNL